MYYVVPSSDSSFWGPAKAGYGTSTEEVQIKLTKMLTTNPKIYSALRKAVQ